MQKIFLIIIAVISIISAEAHEYSYSFKNTPVSEAIVKISKDHPEVNISFIYKDLDNYKTSANIHTDNIYDTLRQVVGINPISIIRKDHNYYIEALQHGKFCYTGRVIGSDNEPVVAATIKLLNPEDSTMITYGITDENGNFAIPCDRHGVLGRLSSLGHKTTYKTFDKFAIGSIIMLENAISLKEVLVESRTQHLINYGSEYIPEKKAKKAAINAINLLELMNIPQLDIIPGSMNVKTFAGKDVGIFIDFKEATEEDLKGLRPEDVLKIEVLQYPDNPRFRSQANVINFIMYKYEWGGYTKMSMTGTTLSINRGNGGIYSKFVNNNWTFDASMSGDISHNDKNQSYDVETFHDIYIGNQYYSKIIRTTLSDGNNLKQNNSQFGSFRAAYQTEKAEITHTISYNRSGNPITRELSKVNYLSESPARSNESGQTISPRLLGNYYFTLPKDNYLIASWSFSYGSTRRNFSYRLDESTPIINNNKETSYAPNVIVQYSKKFTHNNTFRTSLISYSTLYRTYYEGSYNSLQKLLSSENMMFLEYMQNWSCGLNLYSRLGVSYVIGRLNGVNTLEQWNPRLGLQIQHKINNRNSASIEGWWGNNHPTPSSSNSAIVQSNELLWLQGNPKLRNTTFITASASYTYIPTNKLNLSATTEYHGYLNKTAHEYFSLPGYDGLIRKEINSGDFHSISGYISSTLKLLNNSLSFRASGQMSRMVVSGIDAQQMNLIMANLQANYYYKNFSFILYYQTPKKILAPFNNGVRYHYKSTYGLLMNYSLGDLKASLQIRNWFDKYKYYSDFESERYSTHGWTWSSALARSIKLTLTYTIPYGKKVKRNNEISDEGSANSAILK